VRRALLLAVTAASAVLPLAACSALVPTDGPTLATSPAPAYDARGDYAGVFGVLRAERSGDRICLFVDATSGMATGRVDLVFPSGWTATAGGELRDAGGAVVARPGAKVAVSVLPALIDGTPAGCGSPGAATAQALHVAIDD
jgi:hypothetical protein